MTRIFQLLCIIMSFVYISILSRFFRVRLLLRCVYLIYVFSREILFLFLIVVFFVLIIQFKLWIKYFFIKISQINEFSHENKLNIAFLTFVDIIHIIEKKKILVLLKRYVEKTRIFFLLTLFKFVDDVRKFRLLERWSLICMIEVFRFQIVKL